MSICTHMALNALKMYPWRERDKGESRAHTGLDGKVAMVLGRKFKEGNGID